MLFKDNLLLHIYNLFSACKTCCCIHLINFWPNSYNMFSKLCTCVNVCATLVKHIQLVFQHTTCRIRLNFYTIFIKLILKIPNNLAPNMCVTIKYSQLLWHFRTTCYRLKVWLIDWPRNPSFFALSMTKWRLKLFLIWRSSEECHFYSAIVAVRDGTSLFVR